MGSVTPYETATGKRYRVRYRKPDRTQTDKRGFRTKREAELFLASIEAAKSTGRYIDPTRARVTVGDCSKSGAVLRNRTFRRGWFDDAAEAIGVPGLTPHELRHTCASLAVSAGANVKAVQRMLGHSSAKETLDTYSDLFDDDLDAVAVALNQVGAQLNVGKVWANTDLDKLDHR